MSELHRCIAENTEVASEGAASEGAALEAAALEVVWVVDLEMVALSLEMKK